MKSAIGPATFTIMHNVVIWHCPCCGMDQWAQWARKSKSEERIGIIERILNHPICVGCEDNLMKIGVPKYEYDRDR